MGSRRSTPPTQQRLTPQERYARACGPGVPSPGKAVTRQLGPYLIALTVHAQEGALSRGRAALDVADAVRLGRDRTRRTAGA